ncbi:hypothetical protein BVRB_2g040510 [Beta vulgaris subsp. vulgaris]|nr:hypothetical protein BVRB_2g040510 [Beta vulgaris subsp. vulgaris]
MVTYKGPMQRKKFFVCPYLRSDCSFHQCEDHGNKIK